MKRNVKNEKVLRAITIGLATMIAATSAPVTVLAGTEEQQNQNNEQGNGEQKNENKENSSKDDEVVTADEVDVATAETVSEKIEEASQEYDEMHEDNSGSGEENSNSGEGNEENNNSSSLESGLNKEDEAIKEEIDKAKKKIEESDSLQNEDLNNALVQSAVAEANIEALKDTLKNGEQFLESSDKDKAGKDRLQFGVSREPNGDFVIDENNCPKIDDGKAVEQFSYQSDNIPTENTNINLNTRSFQGTYQWGMDEIKKAIQARANGDEDDEKKHLANAGEYLGACQEKFNKSEKVLLTALKQYDAAKAAADSAKESYDKAKDKLNGAISDSQAALDQLQAAEKKAEKLTAISDQYYGLMITYFSKSVGTAVYDENGKLNVEASADAVANLTGKDKQVVYGDELGDDTWALGRGLLKQLVEYKLESEGATNIIFGDTKTDADKVNSTKDSTVKKATFKENTNPDTVQLSDIDPNKTTYKQYRESGYNGRMNHFQVTYTDSKGTHTKYFNVVYKGTEYEGSDVDLTKGICYVAEVKYNEETKKWSYDPYSEESDFLSDYNLTKGYREAAAKVKAAEDEIARLQNELGNLEAKVATNNTYLKEVKGKLDKAEAAYKNSKQSLKDFSELYAFLTDGVQPGKKPASEPSGGDVVPGPGPSGNDIDNITEGDDDASSDDTAGDATYDLGTGTLTIPGFEVPSFVIPAAVAGTMGTATGATTGVLGVRAKNPADQIISSLDSKIVNKPVAKKTIANKTNKKGTKIEDPIVPLAETPFEDSTRLNWGWLLIIFLLGATGKKMYDEYKKKQEEANAAKSK